MAQMHKLKPEDVEISKEACIWNKLEKFMEIMPKKFLDDIKQARYFKILNILVIYYIFIRLIIIIIFRFEKFIKPFIILKQNYQMLKMELISLNNDIVFAHNDLLLGNILYNQKENTVTFIDFEYTAYNYQAFDIANHFAEFAGNINIYAEYFF